MANRGVRESRDILKKSVARDWLRMDSSINSRSSAVRERDSREERKFDLLIGFCKIPERDCHKPEAMFLR